MDLTKLAKEIYEAAKEKGFWEGKRNIGEIFMLIISEAGEAMEAHRKGKRANLPHFDKDSSDGMVYSEYYNENWVLSFEQWIKDSFEDELSDIAIRMLDFMGSQDMEVIDVLSGDTWLEENVGAMLCDNVETIIHAREKIETSKTKWFRESSCRQVIIHVFAIAKQLNIDLMRHIELKLLYNKTRPYKHGKAY